LDWSKVTKELEKSRATTKVPPFPGRERRAAWWHPSKHWIMVPHYHITEVVTNPSKFGITQTDINKAVAQHMDIEIKAKSGVYVTGMSVADGVKRVKDRNVDRVPPLEMLVYSKGWIRVQSGDYIMFAGTDKKTIVAALKALDYGIAYKRGVPLEIVMPKNPDGTMEEVKSYETYDLDKVMRIYGG
jgi:hypothetical protein